MPQGLESAAGAARGRCDVEFEERGRTVDAFSEDDREDSTDCTLVAEARGGSSVPIEALNATPEMDLPDRKEVAVDVKLLVDEARIGCTSAMLLCLDREQRLVRVLGEILAVTDTVASQILDFSRDAFRQKLSRARRDLHSFMNERCGLVNKASACRCEKETRGFMQAGYLDPETLLFARQRVRQVREVARRRHDEMENYEGLASEVFQEHPFHYSADLAGRIHGVVDSPAFRSTFQL